MRHYNCYLVFVRISVEASSINQLCAIRLHETPNVSAVSLHQLITNMRSSIYTMILYNLYLVFIKFITQSRNYYTGIWLGSRSLCVDLYNGKGVVDRFRNQWQISENLNSQQNHQLPIRARSGCNALYCM